MWDVDEPRRDERRHAQPETPRHRARKDRRRWCRGKPGVEHTPVIRVSKTGEMNQVLARQHGRVRPLCRWNHWWKRDHDGKTVPDLDSWHWTCGHEQGCSTCGRILAPSVGEACPDYKPRVPTV